MANFIKGFLTGAANQYVDQEKEQRTQDFELVKTQLAYLNQGIASYRTQQSKATELAAQAKQLAAQYPDQINEDEALSGLMTDPQFGQKLADRKISVQRPAMPAPTSATAPTDGSQPAPAAPPAAPTAPSIMPPKAGLQPASFSPGAAPGNPAPATDFGAAAQGDTSFSTFAPYISYKESRDGQNVNHPVTSSGQQAVGRYGIMPETAKGLGQYGFQYDPSRLKDDDHNYEAGATLWDKELMPKYKNPLLALAAYNGGSTAVDKAIKEHGDPRQGQISYGDFLSYLPTETANYVLDYVNKSVKSASSTQTAQDTAQPQDSGFQNVAAKAVPMDVPVTGSSAVTPPTNAPTQSPMASSSQNDPRISAAMDRASSVVSKALGIPADQVQQMATGQFRMTPPNLKGATFQSGVGRTELQKYVMEHADHFSDADLKTAQDAAAKGDDKTVLGLIDPNAPIRRNMQADITKHTIQGDITNQQALEQKAKLRQQNIDQLKAYMPEDKATKIVDNILQTNLNPADGQRSVIDMSNDTQTRMKTVDEKGRTITTIPQKTIDERNTYLNQIQSTIRKVNANADLVSEKPILSTWLGRDTLARIGENVAPLGILQKSTNQAELGRLTSNFTSLEGDVSHILNEDTGKVSNYGRQRAQMALGEISNAKNNPNTSPARVLAAHEAVLDTAMEKMGNVVLSKYPDAMRSGFNDVREDAANELYSRAKSVGLSEEDAKAYVKKTFNENGIGIK